VQLWINQGAPCERRGRGALVEIEALKRWRSAPGEIDLDRVAAGLWRAFTRAPEGYAEPAWAGLNVGRWRAAALLAEAYVSLHIEITGRPPESVPSYIRSLEEIARQGTPFAK
jgi:hypothetical protein